MRGRYQIVLVPVEVFEVAEDVSLDPMAQTGGSHVRGCLGDF